jgi:hypothetical protein
MHEFIAKHEEQITGILSGFDRLVFRGTLRSIAHAGGMKQYLWANQILLKDFGAHVERVSREIKEASLAEAASLGRPVQYLSSSQVSKEDIARGIASREGIRDGLVCVLSCVEPCWSYEIHRNREAKKLELEPRRRKCLFLYQYWQHPVFGFMNARIQTWFPFAAQICLNGREWLARKLNPIHKRIFRQWPLTYYWSTCQSEWAIDLVFPQPEDLRRLYPRLVHHGMTTFGSADVMRFLGRRVPASGEVPRGFSGEIVGDLKQRQEGVRIKHSINGNSVKLYDKAYTPVGSVLRAEMTMHNGADIRVYRPKENHPDGAMDWRVMRRGIADLNRRAEVSRKAAERYLDALASVDEDTTLEDLIRRLEQPKQWKGRRVRALRPFSSGDSALLEAVSRGEFTVNGFRNRDLQARLFAKPACNECERRRRSAWVGRQLRLLRAHGVILKVTGTHRYQLTVAGRKAATAILTALHSTVRQLSPAAA